MKRHKILLSFVLSILVFSVLSVVHATTVEFTAPYDDGNGQTGWGGEWNDRPGDGVCEVFMNALFTPSTVWCWVGSDRTLTSTKYVSMECELTLTGYIGTGGPWGHGLLQVFLECRDWDDESKVWSVKIYDWVCDWNGDKSKTYSNTDITEYLDFSGFPQQTPSGHYYFVCRISFTGSWAGKFSYEYGSNDRAELEVNSITVSY
jgi:hypothetical protein